MIAHACDACGAQWSAPRRRRTCRACGGGPVRRRSQRTAILTDLEKTARQASICSRIPGFAALIADVAQALGNYAALNEVDVATISPETTVRSGRIIVDLNPAA